MDSIPSATVRMSNKTLYNSANDMSMVLMAAMTVSMLTGCKTSDGKKTEEPSSGNQAAAEGKTEYEGKASVGGEDYSYHWKLAATQSSDYYMTQLSQESPG